MGIPRLRVLNLRVVSGMLSDIQQLAELYSRQVGTNVKPPKSVVIVGVGGIGSWVAILLAMAGTGMIHLVDFDRVEIHNLNRIPLTLGSVGRYKVHEVAKLIQSIRPNAYVQTYTSRFENVVQLLSNQYIDWVIECTDNVKTQRIVRRVCRKYFWRLVEVHYDYDTQAKDWLVSITMFCDPTKIPEDFWCEDSGDTGYRVVQSYVVPPVILASIVTHALCTNMCINIDSTHLTKLIEKISK